jgi:hypothetical protein
MTKPTQSLVRVLQADDGSLTYLIDACPEDLPPVRAADLADAWENAREAASLCRWGSPRRFRFRGPDDARLDLALADADACCWARSVDETAGMQTSYGLSLCLRLLALVDLLARAPLCRIRRSGVVLDPAVLRIAASAPLTNDARFDETLFRVRLDASAPAALISGAPA